ncbi:MAG: CHC2 zinc finger domain-containing protein [Candidatus Acidiferrales bacterium]
MPHVPLEVKEKLKREISIERLAEARGIPLRRSGRNLMGLCPFHNDTHPSLSIDPVKNEWHCFGCGRGGDVIEWVKCAEGVSFNHAVELLKRDYFPSAARSTGPPPKESTTVKLPPLIEHAVDDQTLLKAVVEHYHEALKQSPEAQQYLMRRGLTSSEMIDTFRLGFANRTLTYRVPDKNRKQGEEQRERLKQIGILRKDSGHEHFNGSVVIPIFNLQGEVVEMYGRKITRLTALRDGTEAHTYLSGPLRGVWNEQALITSKEIILCEALIDALTFWCAGYRHVTASYGVNGFTDDHRAAFEKHGTKRIYLAYDRDDAGERAAEKLAEELKGMGIECYRVQFPKGMDANEYALKVTPATRSLGLLLGKAAWLGKGQRPTVAVNEPQIAREKPEPAAKEETITEPVIASASVVPSESAAEEKISATIESNTNAATEEQADFPLAANPPIAALPTGSVVSAPSVPIEVSGETVYVTLGERRYRILELAKNTAPGVLHVNVMVTGTNSRGETRLHVDKLDLYAARPRAIFAKQAAKELGHKEEAIERELSTLVLKLEDLQHEWMEKALKPKEEQIEMTAEEKAEALALLRDPRLLERILEDFERCGVVGEETNKLVSYLAVTSRLLEAPLAVLVQSSSAAGKSAIMEAVLAMLPEEQRVQYSAMTGQSLFYMGETDLKHKVLAIVEEEGASRAAYALKLLQSEGVLSIASTGKDAATGRHITHQYRVEGPVMLFLTTTAIDLDEELLNRCLVLAVDEGREQTQAIHRKQREAQTIEGLLARRERERILRVHRNAQRLLQPLFVANPYARELTFLDSQTRTRRDHMKYLALIRAIALLHQHQRERKTATHNGQALEYIEATLDDIATANRLAHEVLGRSLDELPPQTRRLLLLIDEMVSAECERQETQRADFRFSRRDVRQHTKWGDTQLRVHLRRLEELEYLLVHRGGRGQSFVYELVFERQADSTRPVLPGLIDAEKLSGYSYDANNAGQNGQFAGSSRPQSGGIAGGARGEESPILARRNGGNGSNLEKITTGAAASENRVVHTAAGGR